jgi:hypothetical protein
LRALNVGSLGGLHYELYDLSPARRVVPSILQKSEDQTAFLDLNGVFWMQLLGQEHVAHLVEELTSALDPYAKISNSFRAAVQEPERFLARVREAELGIFEQEQSAQSLYGHLETLAIVCDIHSYLHGGGFTLTIQEGYDLDGFSSVQMIQDCLVERRNPYLPFLEEYAWPALLEFQPELVWLNGRLTLANMAVARFVRRRFPQTKIVWAGEGSEYYATNKITDYLQHNTPLFEVIDAIVLFDYENTRDRLTACMEREGSWAKVNNLMYARRTNDGALQIEQTPYARYGSGSTPEVVLRTQDGPGSWRVSPGELANVHLFPDKTCFWRRCSFCGINRKYPKPLCATPADGLWPTAEALACLEDLERRGIRYFWSIDEAIPVETLTALAQGLSGRDSALIWQARSRISAKFLEPGVAQTLAQGGLRELRLGLESASLRVLSRMNKFEADFSLRLVEAIVAAFCKVGVKVHFPMIVGFPMETVDDRQKTYSFLVYLREHYDNFSFNINIFAMDVSSPLFADWYTYGVSGVSFPCAPQYFLGNLLDWECTEVPFDEEGLRVERDQFMREILYPWMPSESLISPHILYRLLETTRNTLLQPRSNEPPPESTMYRLSGDVLRLTGAADREGMFRYYSWRTHRSLTAAGSLSAFFAFAAAPHTMPELERHLLAMNWATEDTIEELMRKVMDAGFLEPIPTAKTANEVRQ